MKKLILKLIEIQHGPIGGLSYSKVDGFYVSSIERQGYAGDKNFLPYGISDDKIEADSKVYNNFLGVLEVKAITRGAVAQLSDGTVTSLDNLKKIELLPEQFNYQDIIDLGLKDGDEFMYSSGYVTEIGKAEIYKPTTQPVTIEPTKVEGYVDLSSPSKLDSYLNKFGNELLQGFAHHTVQKSSNGIAAFVTEFMQKNKLK